MQISGRPIGPGCEPYIIAEVGVNHDGSVDRALLLVEAAAAAGCDAVKLQLFRADLLMSKAARLAHYQTRAGETDPLEMLRRLELRVHQMGPIVQRAHARGLHAIVTVFSLELLDEALRLPWDALKTASPDIIHRPLLEALTASGRPLIISTGASTAMEVQRALEWLTPAHDRLALLQCVSSYPTPLDDAAMEAMGDLATMFDGPIGYSDHTPDADSSLRAVLLGACVLEKHITMDRSLPGPDHAASLEPPALARYVREARRAPRLADEYPQYAQRIAARARQGTKLVLERERDVRTVSRQSIVARADLPAGHTLRREDLTFKRPGTGIEPFRIDETLGRRLVRPVSQDLPLVREDLGDSVTPPG